MNASEDYPYPFTRLEYIEFSSMEEFAKFRKTKVITEADIAATCIEDLSRKLQKEDSECR